jgi:dienelactone hydrolase
LAVKSFLLLHKIAYTDPTSRAPQQCFGAILKRENTDLMRLRVKHAPMKSFTTNAWPRSPTHRFRASLVTNLCFALCACQDLTAQATRTASLAGLAAAVVPGTRYRHQVFVSSPLSGTPLFVFIDGDGSPWRHGGSYVSRDPTPDRPLALELAARTPGCVIYLGRPCYFSTTNDPTCAAPVWTSARYSTEVVESIAAVVNRYAAENHSRCVVLVGYSGGGALSVLTAPLVPTACAVVTIAADLDIDAWTDWHHYLPLTGSLNPATQAPLDSHIAQWHLVGDRDSNVPSQLSRRYLERVPGERIWHFSAFDHTCCWVEQWPDILARIDREIVVPAAGAAPVSHPD